MNKLRFLFILLILAASMFNGRADDRKDKYILTYLVDGKQYYSEKLSVGDVIVPLAPPVKEGYVFTGWKNIPPKMPARDMEVSGSLVLEKYSGLSKMREVKVDSIMYKLANMTVDDYLNLELPSLDVLFENARQAEAVKYFELEAESYRYATKSAKLTPLQWVRAYATYSYGNTDMAAILLSESTYQVWQQNTARQRQMYYNVGASISIPLYDIFNMRNNIKQLDSKYLQTKHRQESEINLLKERIVDTYCTIIEKISTLNTSFQALVMAEAQYELAENQFLNNQLNADGLYRSKTFEHTCRADYENNKKALNAALLTLEIISCTPIISK